MTEEDRILHDAAARAAGYDIWWKDSICKGGRVLAAFIGERPWRPRDDSGDSFRLMLACDIKLSRLFPIVFAERGAYACAMPIEQDGEAAARLAVFNLAAQLYQEPQQ